jgi:hypothetical protein
VAAKAAKAVAAVEASTEAAAADQLQATGRAVRAVTYQDGRLELTAAAIRGAERIPGLGVGCRLRRADSGCISGRSIVDNGVGCGPCSGGHAVRSYAQHARTCEHGEIAFHCLLQGIGPWSSRPAKIVGSDDRGDWAPTGHQHERIRNKLVP